MTRRQPYVILRTKLRILTDRVSGKGNAIDYVRPSVCPFVSTLSYEPTNL